VGGGGQRKQPTREGSRDDNDGTIFGSKGFVHRLKHNQQTKGRQRWQQMRKEQERQQNGGGWPIEQRDLTVFFRKRKEINRFGKCSIILHSAAPAI
jgi:hypothetical protein